MGAGKFFSYFLVAFLLGIALHSIWPLIKISTQIWVFVFAGFMLAFSLVKKKSKALNIWFVMIVTLFGVWRFDCRIPGVSDGLMPWLGKSAELIGVVTNVGKSNGTPLVTVKVRTADAIRINSPASKINARVLDDLLEIGTEVKFLCNLKKPLVYPSNTNSRLNLARKDIWLECSQKIEYQIISKPSSYDPIVIFSRLRNNLSERITRVLPQAEATLLTGILYGDQDFSPDDKKLFQRAGLMHLVAVSGSNVTIVVAVLLPSILWFGFRRQQAFWLLSFGLVFFVLFVGLSASIMRAAFMGWLILLSRYLGRVAWVDRTLLVAAVFLNIINPWSLVFDVGFALSFLATWGLMVWSPIFEKRFYFLPKMFGMREAATTTCSAIFMTAPYVAFVFGRVSLVGLLTNALALPLVPWTMFWGVVSILWGELPGYNLVSLPVFGLLRLVYIIASISNYASWMEMIFPTLNFWYMSGIYVLYYQIWRQQSKELTLYTSK